MPETSIAAPAPFRSEAPPDRRLAVAILLGLLLVSVGATLLNRSVAQHLVHREAEDTAIAWSNSLVGLIGPQLPAVLNRQPLPTATIAALSQALGFGGAYRYSLFDAQGDLVFVSDHLQGAGSIAESRLEHRADSSIAARVLGGAGHVVTARGTEPGDPGFRAEVYVPILSEGRVIGVAEVHLDQSSKECFYEHTFLLLQGLAVGLIVLASIPPGLLAWRRSRGRRAAEARVHFLAHHDALTGLPNRERLHEVLQQALALARRGGPGVAVVALDLDGFKEVNDRLGHAAGDALLRGVAERIQGLLRAEDLVARLGGDEFVVVQIGASQPASAGRLGERILAALNEPFDLDGDRALVGCSAGIAMAPANGDTPDRLLARADAALYRSKAEGRGTVRFFEPGMDAALRARRALEQDLRAAVADNGFGLAFQPLCTLPDGRLSGFEALLRWNRPGHGPISPDAFVPLAEETGLIVPIGAWVLETACRAAAAWPPGVTVAVNLSPAQFRRGDLVKTVATALEVSGLDPARLELEVTEGLLLQDNDSVLAILTALRGMGVSIAMDDFGTGYSSLAYLWRFPFNKLKIDRSFVAGVNENMKLVSIIEAVVALGRSLGLEVTAEGVETEQEAALLRMLGCDLGQGYLLGRPMDAAQATALAERERNPRPAAGIANAA